jgi:hypothetical protein
MPPTKTMSLRTKAVLINSSIMLGLLFEYWTGKPLVAVVIAGILLFVVANLVMMFAARKRDEAKNRSDL